MAEAEKDDWLDDFDSLDDKGSALDQSDFDALLSGASGPGTAAGSPPPGKEEGAELDQSAIDTLMSGTGSPPSAGESSELDQSDIDSLLASPNAPVTDQGAIDPDQEEIDKLFSDVESGGNEEENTFPAEEIDFKDVFDGTDPAPQGTNLDFDAEEFKLDVDIPEIPANPPAPDFGAPPVQAEAAITAPVAAAAPTMKVTPETVSVESTPESAGPDVAAQGLGLLHNRALRMGLGVGLAVLLGVVGFFFMKDRAKTPPAHQQAAEVAVHPTPAVKPQEPAIPPPEPPPAPEPPKPEPEPAKPHNAAPTVADLDLTVPPESSQLTITLNGTDPENDPLQYVMSMPEHGLLSGHPPNIVYTPNQDFNGQDGFIVRATDGKNISTPATIKISGKFSASAKGAPPGGTEGKPDGSGPLEAAKTEKAGACPAKEDGEKGQGLLAKNKFYTLSGSKGLVINWQKIWCDANSVPYKPDVEIDILAAPKHGALNKINDHQSLYRPGQAFRGKDSITYRFKQGTLTSESKTIQVSVARKKSPPVIRLQPIAASYMTGDTVILNASQTSVGRHEPLTFHWTQLAGVPVRIKPLNTEGSQISFVVPSSYSAVSHPTLLIQVTATDQEGLQGSRDIKITAQSRRQSALWDARN